MKPHFRDVKKNNLETPTNYIDPSLCSGKSGMNKIKIEGSILIIHHLFCVHCDLNSINTFIRTIY